VEGREVNLNLDNVFKYTGVFLEITPKREKDVGDIIVPISHILKHAIYDI